MTSPQTHPRRRPPARWVLRLPVRYPFRTVIIASACVAAAAVSAQRLRPDASLESMFPGGDPAADALRRVMNDFRAMDELLLLVGLPPEAGPDAGNGAPERLLAFADRLQRRLNDDIRTAHLIHSVRYRSSSEIHRFAREVMLPSAAYYLDDASVRELAHMLGAQRIRQQVQRNEALIAAPTASARIKRLIREDPLGVRAFLADAFEQRLGAAMVGTGSRGAYLSADGRHLLVRIRGRRPASDLGFTSELVDAVRRAVSAADPSGLSVAYGGGYAITAYSAEHIRSDLIRSTAGSIVLISLLFVLVYRSIWSLPLALLPLGIGILVGFGLYACFSGGLSPLTGAAGGILAGLGIDYCIHGLSVAGRPGASRSGPRRIGLELSGPMTTACVSSMIGFGAIATSSIPALQRFGLLGMLGLAGTLASALCVLPAMLRILQRRKRRAPAARACRGVGASMNWIVRRARPCAAATLLLMAAAVLWLALIVPERLHLENDPRDLEPQPNAAGLTQMKIDRLFSSAEAPLILLIETDSSRALLTTAHRARDRLLAAGADSVFGIGALLPDPELLDERQRRLQQRIDVQSVIRDLRTVLEQSRFRATAYDDYIEFLHRLLRPEKPPGVDALRSYPTLAAAVLEHGAFEENRSPRRAISLVFGTGEGGGSGGSVERELQASVAKVPGAILTGMPIVGRGIQDAVRLELPRLMGVSAVAVCVWLLIVFRDPIHVIMICLPAVGAFLTVGILLGVGAIRLNPITLVIAPLVAGLSVDDGVFVLRSAAGARADKLAAKLGNTLSAITMTSMTTGLAFASLILTSTPAIRAMGLAMAAGILGAWGTTVFLLIPLLILDQRTCTGRM